MTKLEFLNQLVEIMQLEISLTGTENLEDFVEWDSMASLGVMSLFDMEFGTTLKATDLKNATTVNDLVALAGENLIE